MWPVWILISLRREPAHLSFMASTNAVLATVYLLVTYSVCVCVCVCEAVYVITIFLTKPMSMNAVRTLAMQQKQLVTGLGHKPQRTQKKQLSQSFSAYWWPQWWHKSSKHAPNLSHWDQHADGSDFAVGPHTLPIKLNIYTHHTCITLLYPTNTIKNVYHL